MIFEYEELKEYVREDFTRFYFMKFTDEQIVNAVLNEYKYAPDYCFTEKVCIYIILAKIFIKYNLNQKLIVDRLNEIELQKWDDISNEIGLDWWKVDEDLCKIREL
ncbi:MAG: hypothetical protein K6G88_04220 [Lachnospiraceae bacterium]|nr:hypothetical protein [Lachnospiraceae bacterium]